MQRTIGYLSGYNDVEIRADYHDYHEIRINVKVKSNNGLICPITIGSYIESDEDAVFMNKLLVTKQKPLPELFWDLFEKGDKYISDDFWNGGVKLPYYTKRSKRIINEEFIKEKANEYISTPSNVIKYLQTKDFEICDNLLP